MGNADKHIVDDAISFVEESFRIGKSVSIIAEELSARLARYGLNISFDIARAFVELVAVRAGIVGAITKLGFRGVKGWVKLNKSELVSLHTAHEFVKNIEQLGDFATDIPKSMISKLTAKLAK